MKISYIYQVSIIFMVLLVSSASAQIKPKVMIIFDTSGSMLQRGSTARSGDGSELCGGRGKNSRIYQLKQAFFEVLQGIGAQEVDFALSTFPMMMDPNRTPKCFNDCWIDGINCSGHYYAVPSQASEISEWTDERQACKVSTHNPNTQQNADCKASGNPCTAWYDNMKKEVIKVPFANTSPEKVLLFFDQKEDPTPTSVLRNPEVRAGENWYTPLGKTLFYIHGYFHREVVLPASDYRKKCERLVVALFTDGAETCNESWRSAFYPTKWSASMNSKMGVVTHTVAIDFASPNSLLAQIATEGKGASYNVEGNTASLKQAFMDIIAKSLIPSEICNGLDDDCDNKIDEDFPLKGTPCNNGMLGRCNEPGIYVCKKDGTGVVCNAPQGSGTKEICNGLDDDCDGQIDEEEDAGVCTPCVPQPEICNNRDDNCNLKIDEDIPSVPCGKSIGECKPGNTKCVNGRLICLGETGPTNEKCNGLDDDCDGIRDSITDTCYTFSTGCEYKDGTGWICKGFCRPGMHNCTAQKKGNVWEGVWGKCVGEVGPSPEKCDGLDNDCDGTVDEMAECPGDSKCISGQCARSCANGEFVCPSGQICKDGWCIIDPCDRAACDAQGWICKAGECVDPCKEVSCPSKYETCIKGICMDTTCYNSKNKCPDGQKCVQGECVSDPCAKQTCKSDEFCRNGSCVKLCEALTCAPDEICVVTTDSGTPVSKCEKDPCAGQDCGEGRICDKRKGICAPDPCYKISCDKGEDCKDGACIPDVCEYVTCPTHYICKKGSCVTSELLSTTDMLATGTGGLACTIEPEGRNTAGSFAGLFWLFVLSLLILGSRRR